MYTTLLATAQGFALSQGGNTCELGVPRFCVDMPYLLGFGCSLETHLCRPACENVSVERETHTHNQVPYVMNSLLHSSIVLGYGDAFKPSKQAQMFLQCVRVHVLTLVTLGCCRVQLACALLPQPSMSQTGRSLVGTH